MCLSVLSDIKKLYRLTGVDNKPTVFLFNDTQIVDESFLEDINNILSSGEVPNLYKQDEFVEVSIIFCNLKSNPSNQQVELERLKHSKQKHGFTIKTKMFLLSDDLNG